MNITDPISTRVHPQITNQVDHYCRALGFKDRSQFFRFLVTESVKDPISILKAQARDHQRKLQSCMDRIRQLETLSKEDLKSPLHITSIISRQ